MNLRQARKSSRKTVRQQRLLTKEFRVVLLHGQDWRHSLRQFVVDTPEYLARQRRMAKARAELSRRAVRALHRHQAPNTYGIELAHAAMASEVR